MPAALDVDREQVRMLVMQIGVRDAARRCNLNENTVLAWANRGEWLTHLKNPPLDNRPISMQSRPAIGAIKPADALANTLMEEGNTTRLEGMRYARRTVKYAADLAEADPETAMAHAPNVKAALQSAALAGSWSEGKSEAQVSLQFFSITQERAEKERKESPEHRIYDIPGGSSDEEQGTTDALNDPMF